MAIRSAKKITDRFITLSTIWYFIKGSKYSVLGQLRVGVERWLDRRRFLADDFKQEFDS